MQPIKVSKGELNMDNKAVTCLYRASTLQQVDPKLDLPMQREECRKFAENMGWSVEKEYQELGVSGYKVSEKKRDAIQDIRRDVETGKLKRLLVFMCDRIGRKADETPFVVEWLVSKGVEVWSAMEGQQKIETHTDKLINYIRYWQAEGESEKTSMRVRVKHQQMVEEGIWRGGLTPYGYKTEHRGRIGKKNRPLLDLVKDEKTGHIVDMIFQYVTYKGWGTYRLANLLNEKYPDPSKVWTAQTIRAMISNPIYTGRFRFHEILSPTNEELRYVPDSMFEMAQRAIASRIARKYPIHRVEEGASVQDGQTKTAVYGASLLSGILYCAHCNHKLEGTYHTKQRRNGAYHRPVYRCYNGATNAKHCDGQSTYSAKIIEDAVLMAVREYFDYFHTDVQSIWSVQTQRQMKRKNSNELWHLRKRLETLEDEYEGLNKELVNVAMGRSALSPERLNLVMAENEAKIAKTKREIADCEAEQADAGRKLKHLSQEVEQIKKWAVEFDSFDNDEKKMILAHMIEKITCSKDYEISIHFYIAMEDFQEAIARSKADGYNVVIVEAETPQIVIA
jgi:DNA invertase Pin-like site-specific DNA recombinase